jgi:hypothetical protein
MSMYPFPSIYPLVYVPFRLSIRSLYTQMYRIYRLTQRLNLYIYIYIYISFNYIDLDILHVNA